MQRFVALEKIVYGLDERFAQQTSDIITRLDDKLMNEVELKIDLEEVIGRLKKIEDEQQEQRHSLQRLQEQQALICLCVSLASRFSFG